MNHNILKQEINKYCESTIDYMEVLNNKTVAVFGATGLIGSLIAKIILRYNEVHNTYIKVVCVSRNESKMKEIFEEYCDDSNLHIVQGDVLDDISIHENVDYIIHCANTTSSYEYVNKPVETINTIVSGTQHILEYAKKINATVVYLSSMEIYGQPYFRDGYTYESDKGLIDSMSVRSSYSEGKRIAECMCKAYASEYALNVKVARLAQVFGPGIPDTDNRVFSQLAKSAINGTDFVMRSYGKSEGNYCYSLDAVMGILILLSKGENGEAYNIVNEETHTTIIEMAKMVSNEIAQNFQVRIEIPENDLQFGYAPDTKLHLSAEKMRKLGWEPKVSLKEMYIKLIESMR